MASLAGWLPSFPLLRKELTELAARPRTYVMRVLVCLALGLAFALPYTAVLALSDDPLRLIGQGRPLFDAVFWCTAAAIVLFVPASAAMSVASERQRGSLVGLLLTPMGPWSLLAQKWLSRQVLVATLVAAAIPGLVLAHSLGGVDTERIVVAAATLLVAGAQGAALGVAVGAWTRTGTASVLVTLAAMLAIAAWEPCRTVLFDPHWWSPFFDGDPLGMLASGRPHPFYAYASWDAFIHTTAASPTSWRNLGSVGWTAPTLALVISWPALAMPVVGAVIARAGITRGLERHGPGPLLRAFLALDRWFARAERRIGRTAAVDLPGADPVAWRERNRRALANMRYLVRLFVVLGTLAIVVALAVAGGRGAAERLDALVVVAVAVTMLLALVLGVGSFERDRAAQTLAVLLATPMTSTQIVGQKVVPLRRLLAMLWLVAALLVGLRWFLRPLDSAGEAWALAGCLLLGAAAPIALAWLGALCGLLVRSRARAGALALGMVTVWTLGPFAVSLTVARAAYSAHHSPLIESLSPVGFVLAIDGDTLADRLLRFRDDHGTAPWQLIAAIVGSCLALGAGARLVTSLASDRLLRRSAADG